MPLCSKDRSQLAASHASRRCNTSLKILKKMIRLYHGYRIYERSALRPRDYTPLERLPCWPAWPSEILSFGCNPYNFIISYWDWDCPSRNTPLLLWISISLTCKLLVNCLLSFKNCLHRINRFLLSSVGSRDPSIKAKDYIKAQKQKGQFHYSFNPSRPINFLGMLTY